MTTFETMCKLIKDNVDFELTATHKTLGGTETFWVTDRNKFYPEHELTKKPFFWYVNDYGIDSVFYPDDYDIVITVDGKEVK